MMKLIFFSMSLMIYLNNLNMIQCLVFLMSFLMIFNLSSLMNYMITLNYSLNLYTFGLLILTFWIFGLMFMSIKLINKKKLCSFLILMLMMVLIMAFLSINLFLYYLFFEISLVPTFLMILYWGLGSQRVLASYYFIFYTMIFSLPMMLILFYLDKINGSLSMLMMVFKSINLEKLYLLIMLMGFLVKIPFYLLHSWLLKAHVEAPVFGSMVLASLLLKLGGYGIILMLNMVYDYFSNDLKNLFFMISLIGSMILSILCMCQIDLKILVAYSSIVHMGVMLCGIFSMMKIGILGGYLMMISHGFSSSGLFYLVNVNYERLNTRSIFLNKGMINFMPKMSLMWFLLCSSNMAVPFSLNLVSEVFLIMSMMIYNLNLMLMIILICFFSFLYSLYLFSWVQHGSYSKFYMFSSGKTLEFLNLLLHWIPLNILIFNLSILF